MFSRPWQISRTTTLHQPSLSLLVFHPLLVCTSTLCSGLVLPHVLSSKRRLCPSLLPPESAQRGPTLSQSPGPIRCVLERRKLKSSKAPPCPPRLNLQVALVLRLGTGTVPRGLKRPVKPPARRPRPRKLKLTRGAHTTPVVWSVSVAGRGPQGACCPWLPVVLHAPSAWARVIEEEKKDSARARRNRQLHAVVLFSSAFPSVWLFISYSRSRDVDKWSLID